MSTPSSRHFIVRAALPMLAAIVTACASSPAPTPGDLSQDGTATIHGYPRSVQAAGLPFATTVAGVDDGNAVPLDDARGVVVLAGHVRVRGLIVPGASGANAPSIERTATFEAAPGHDYELRGRASQVTPPVAFDVWDVVEGVEASRSDPTAEECVTALVAWDGRKWTEADWSRSQQRVSATFLPPGAALLAWEERVDLEYCASEDALGLDEVREARFDALDSVCDDAWQQELDDRADQVVFTWSGIEPGKGLKQGVTCLRQDNKGYHALSYAVRGTLPTPVASAWAARFTTAKLLPPSR